MYNPDELELLLVTLFALLSLLLVALMFALLIPPIETVVVVVLGAG